MYLLNLINVYSLEQCDAGLIKIENDDINHTIKKRGGKDTHEFVRITMKNTTNTGCSSHFRGQEAQAFFYRFPYNFNNVSCIYYQC